MGGNRTTITTESWYDYNAGIPIAPMPEPSHRRKGHGSALMAHAKEYFCGNAKGFILLMEKSNATAKSFCENDGWTCADYDLYTFFYG